MGVLLLQAGGRCCTQFTRSPRFQRALSNLSPSFRFEVVIVWRIQIDDEGKVLPKLDLLTQVPQRGRACGVCDVPTEMPTYHIWFDEAGSKS